MLCCRDRDRSADAAGCAGDDHHLTFQNVTHFYPLILEVGPLRKFKAADRHAAIDHKHLTKDVARLSRAQPNGRGRDFTGLAAALGRYGRAGLAGEGRILYFHTTSPFHQLADRTDFVRIVLMVQVGK